MSGRRVVSGMWASSGCATIGASTPSTSSSTAECLGSSRSGASRSSITVPVCLRGALLQQVADLREQSHIVRGRLRLRRLELAARRKGVQRLDDAEEDHRGYRQERDQRVDEGAVEELRTVDRERERAEVRLADDRRDQRGEQ